jgi:hypothetical protein
VLYEKSPAHQTLREWSVFRGHVPSKTTYVEGLDLLRQSLTIENAILFIDTVARQMPYHPKEMLYIVDWLTRRGRREYEPLRVKLQAESGGMLCHDPPPVTPAPKD